MTSTYTLVVQGSMALGSFGFGVLAQQASVSRSILSASFVAAAGLVLVRLFPMPESVAKASAT